MIIDSTLVFLDNAEMKTGESSPVGLTGLLHPGRMEPVPFCLKVLQADAGVTALEIMLKQSDSKDGSYEDVPNACLAFQQAELQEGASIGWRWLPKTATKPWLKLELAVTGGTNEGRLFAAVMREEELLYTDKMYVDKGTIVA